MAANLSANVVRVLKDPTLAAALAQFAADLLASKRQTEALAWGHEADGEAEVEVMPAPVHVATLGALAGVAYLADKKGDGLSLYQHEFDTPRPMLGVTRSGDLLIVRGRSQYTTRRHGIIG